MLAEVVCTRTDLLSQKCRRHGAIRATFG